MRGLKGAGVVLGLGLLLAGCVDDGGGYRGGYHGGGYYGPAYRGPAYYAPPRRDWGRPDYRHQHRHDDRRDWGRDDRRGRDHSPPPAPRRDNQNHPATEAFRDLINPRR